MALLRGPRFDTQNMEEHALVHSTLLLNTNAPQVAVLALEAHDGVEGKRLGP